MKILDLVEISNWDRQDLPKSRQELLDLAGLPQDFVLRPLPDFPSVEEVHQCIGWPNARYSSGVTEEWKTLHKDIEHYPKLVQQAILKAWGQRGRLTAHAFGYIWSEKAYLEYIKEVQQRHKIIQDILDSEIP